MAAADERPLGQATLLNFTREDEQQTRAFSVAVPADFKGEVRVTASVQDGRQSAEAEALIGDKKEEEPDLECHRLQSIRGQMLKVTPGAPSAMVDPCYNAVAPPPGPVRPDTLVVAGSQSALHNFVHGHHAAGENPCFLPRPSAFRLGPRHQPTGSGDCLGRARWVRRDYRQGLGPGGAPKPILGR
ncbi:MAG: hypothetical protein IH933_10815 [Euryarchaeota archaeon]|nr:hypothetical protein [Euryarchaeota archaeon]